MAEVLNGVTVQKSEIVACAAAFSGEGVDLAKTVPQQCWKGEPRPILRSEIGDLKKFSLHGSMHPVDLLTLLK